MKEVMIFPICGNCGESLKSVKNEQYTCDCYRVYKKVDFPKICCDLCFSPLVFVDKKRTMCSNLECEAYSIRIRVTTGSHLLLYGNTVVASYPKETKMRQLLLKEKELYAKMLIEIWNRRFPQFRIE